MTKRFIAIVEGFTKEQEAEFASALSRPIAWWHQVGGVWLIYDPSDTQTEVSIRDIVGRISDKALTLVVPASVGPWAGRWAPNPTWNTWLDTYWRNPP